MSLEQQKLARLDQYRRDRDLAAVWFARPNNFAWLTGGDNTVSQAAPNGVAAAGYDGTTVHVVTSNNEVDRFEGEELPADVSTSSYDWYESSLAEAVRERSPDPARADFDVDGFDRIDTPAFRWPLTDREMERYRELGEETASAVESVGSELTPETAEREAAAELGRALVERGIDAPVVLVGSADRAQRHRHFTPTETPLEEYGILTVVGRRQGLHVAVTRTVAFDPPTWLADRHRAAGRVNATAVCATRAAVTDDTVASTVFDAVRSAYETVGCPDEWTRHHQGGAIGYDGREWVATPTSSMPVEGSMAYAWNPTVRGAKVEETFLVTDEGIELLSETGDWPTTSYGSTVHDGDVPVHDVHYVDG